MGELDVGRDHAERALLAARELQQPTLIAAALFASGVARARTEPDEALTFLYEALEQTRALSLDTERSASLVLIATLEAFHGDARRGLAALQEMLRWQSEAAYSGFYPLGAPLYIAVQVFNRVGRPDLVARCSGYSQPREYISTRMYTSFHDLAVDEARSVLGTERFAELEADGAAAMDEEFHSAVLTEVDTLLARPDV